MPAESGGRVPRAPLERSTRDAHWERLLGRCRASDREARVGGESDDLALVDTLGGDDAELRRRELVITLRQARHVLSERERYVAHLRFAEDRTQSEIAQRIGVSQMQVSRILRALLAKLRLELRRQGSGARLERPGRPA